MTDPRVEKLIAYYRQQDIEPLESDFSPVFAELDAAGLTVIDTTNAATKAAVRNEIEHWVGPNLTGWPAFPDRYFGGLTDAILRALRQGNLR